MNPSGCSVRHYTFPIILDSNRWRFAVSQEAVIAGQHRRGCCGLGEPAREEPPGGGVFRDGHWLVGHGLPAITMPGMLRITSRRHFAGSAGVLA